MVRVIQEGQTPPREAMPFKYTGKFPWKKLKAGESFLVVTSGMSDEDYKKKLASLRSGASTHGKTLHCKFDVFRLTPEEGIRVRRDDQ